jgi:hypothetical protein
MSAPSVRILFLVFLGKHRLKSPTMQGEGDHIGGGEPLVRERGEQAFGDHAFAGLADAVLFRACRMGSHDHAAAAARRAHRDIGAVGEGSHQGAFRAADVGIGRQVEP